MRFDRRQYAAAAVVMLGLTCGRSWGQQLYTADRKAQVAVFGGFSYVNPDWDSATISHNLGWTVGGDFDLRPIHRIFSPGVEGRMMRTSGPGAESETELAGGLRLHLYLGDFQPYGAFLMGYGSLHYPVPITDARGTHIGDNALVWNEAVGVDYQVTRHWAARVELLEQQWNTSPETFAPWGVTVGARYRFFTGGPQTR